MKNPGITIRQQIVIDKPRDLVWDYTQDYAYRREWDDAVLETELLQTAPRMVRVRLQGNTTMTFVYKLDDRPHKTTLAARDISSPIIESAGGSWVYEVQGKGTLWTQTNTIVLKNNFFLSIFSPVFRMMFGHQTKKAMRKAKKKLELIS